MTTAPALTSTPERSRRFPIRFKLAAALAVPVVILLFVAVTQIIQVRQDARDADEQAELALVADGPGSLFDALQNERSATYFELIGLPPEELDFPVGLDEARTEADESVSAFEALLDGKSDRIQDLYRPALESLSTVDDLRAEVDDYPGQRNYQPEDYARADEIFAAYSAVIGQLSEANIEVMLAIEDPNLRIGAELGRLASRQGDLIAQLTVSFLAALAEPDVLRTEMIRISRIQGELETNDVMARSLAKGPYSRFVEHLDGGDEIDIWAQIVQDSLETGEYDLEAAQALEDESSSSSTEEWSYGLFRQDVADEVREQADRVRTEAANRQRLYFMLGLLGLVVAGGAAWLVSWSITRPLRSLTSQATTMAGERLPTAVQHVLETPLGQDVSVPHVAPIIVETSDEVADVAHALNTVQDSALDLAVEQAMLRRNIADSFVNLGRRNQQLLSRQLDFITELEHNETDPDTLANLFRLDHLATRMRRNAESLLVLAGVDPPRKWIAPVRLTDVIRAALGEVEDYQRVTVHDVGPVTVAGSAAADLAHLLAELLENSLTFSSATQLVEVHGRSQPVAGGPPGGSNASPDGYALAIVDAGMGMHQDEIAQANRRLAGTESFTVAPSKYLGHYVAGIIAARHGITVQLYSNPNLGVTATVALPPALLTTGQGEIPQGPTAGQAPAPAPQP